MNRFAPLLCLLLLLAAGLASRASAQTADPILSYPASGEVLRGLVTVRGSSALVDFSSAELSFSYAGDPTGTWFRIARFDRPVVNQPLTTWDTTAISDGDYALRLRVTLQDGSSRQVLVTGLQVRNYSPAGTLPAAAAPQATAAPPANPTPTRPPTPTSLAGNPAELDSREIGLSLAVGGLAAIGLLLLVFLRGWAQRRIS